MPTKTLYFLNTTGASPNFMGSMQEGGSAPANVVTTAGFQPAKVAVTTPFYRGRWGAAAKQTAALASPGWIASTSGPADGSGTTITTAGDSFVSPTNYNGTFAAGAWTITLAARVTTITAVGRMRMRVWAADDSEALTGVRELTTGALVGSIVTMSATTTTYTSAITWSPAAITLDNEYLFFQIEWEETTAGTSNSTALGLYTGAALITTTNFTLGPVTGTLAETEDPDTATNGFTGLVGLIGTLAVTEAGADDATFTGTIIDPVTGVLGAVDAQAYELLLHMEGPDGSTTFPDSGGGNHTVTVHGAAQVATQSVFAGQALKLEGAGDHLSLDTGDYAFGTNDFCIDLRVQLSNGLGLPLVAWEGGPAYWGAFAKASAAGWTDPSFFPIAVFLGKSDSGHPAILKALGINVYCAAEHQTPISQATDTGMFVLASNSISLPGEWTTAEIGSDPKVVGWFVADECEMGLSGCTLPTEGENLTLFQGWCSSLRALNDGRFLFANWGNGVLGTFWSPNTMDEHVAAVDGGGVDKYAYTSGGVRFEIGRAPNWNAEGGTEANALSCASYGWIARQMKKVYTTPTTQKPFWTVVETKMPYLGGGDTRSIITYAQIEAAVFSAIASEARGIIYFQHNGFYDEGTPPAIDPNTGAAPTTETYSLAQGLSGLKAFVTDLNARVTALAPIINTQSYVWNFGATGIDTMLKAKDGFAYIFASIGVAGTTGSKTFALPSMIIGTSVEVVNESRSLSVSSSHFTDSFAAESSHHIYKIAASTEASSTKVFLYDGGTTGPKIYYDGALKFQSAAGTITGGSLAASTNYHIAATRGAGQTRLWLDGVQQGSTLTDATNYGVTASYPRIGGAEPLGVMAAIETITDVLSFTGSVQWAAVLAATDAPDIVAFAGLVRWLATLGAIEVADVSAITGRVSAFGTLAVTEAADVMVINGLVGRSGTLSTTDAPDVAAFTGTAIPHADSTSTTADNNILKADAS